MAALAHSDQQRDGLLRTVLLHTHRHRHSRAHAHSCRRTHAVATVLNPNPGAAVFLFACICVCCCAAPRPCEEASFRLCLAGTRQSSRIQHCNTHAELRGRTHTHANPHAQRYPRTRGHVRAYAPHGRRGRGEPSPGAHVGGGQRACLGTHRAFPRCLVQH